MVELRIPIKLSTGKFIGTGKTESGKEIATGFKEAKALLAECTLLEEFGIDFPPGGEWMEFVWVDGGGNKIATGSWYCGGYYKVKVGEHEFTGGQAENLTRYYKTKQTRW